MIRYLDVVRLRLRARRGPERHVTPSTTSRGDKCCTKWCMHGQAEVFSSLLVDRRIELTQKGVLLVAVAHPQSCFPGGTASQYQT